MPQEASAERIYKGQVGLGASARVSVLWAGSFTLLRDAAQFACMLVLVRLLSPADYGNAALAQSIVGLISVVSFGTFITHALQLRDPAQVDWQAHFSAATVMNSVLFGLTLLIAWMLSHTSRYNSAALPLAGLATTFIVEIAGTLRHRMLEVNHEWRRFRVLVIIGTYLGLVTGVTVALLGGGVWALVVQPPMFGLPAAIDLFWFGRWRPNWSWNWPRYRDTAIFGVNRVGSAALARLRQTTQQTVMAGAYNLTALGIFTRSVGLGTVIAGRIGSVAMQALYPVITRAEQGSLQFQRYAGLVLCGVSWVSVAAAAFLMVDAADIVSLIYGPRWSGVVPLLPLAVAGVGFSGIATVCGSLLLANNSIRTCLVLDTVSSTTAVALAFLLIPRGIILYLAALMAHGAALLGLTLVLLLSKRGISTRSIRTALLPSAIAGAAGVCAVIEARAFLGVSEFVVMRLGVDFALYSIAYLLVLRLLFIEPLRELLDVAPGGRWIARFLLLATRADLHALCVAGSDNAIKGR